MSSKFKGGDGNWVQYRTLPQVKEIDLHYSDHGGMNKPYWERMDDIYEEVLQELKSAYESGDVRFLLIRHGSSTSHRGNTTSRSQVRKLMRSPHATPYLIRKESIQHPSVFVAAIRARSTVT